ncbi:site-specific integrase [Mesorhizobium sp.]|uniref:site-specific integrase n=1 Tax=Mesorhizobium sp. TaxID=1871066 RepID=UPI0012243349|nr:site-specific integrase [Mesorhizobium sp.]TIQ11017.1 MAG: site-specific integrase [Mesorhizobium sp.]
MAKISKRTVDASEKGAKPYFVWDDDLKGFGLLVLPSGVKSYIYQYRTSGGASRRLTIGKHGKLTAEQARTLAEGHNNAVFNGRDPAGEKKDKRHAAKVNDLLDAYVESETFKNKAEKTRAIDTGRIDRHLRPLLGSLAVPTLRPNDISKAYASIRDGKTAKREKIGFRKLSRVTGGEGAARKSIRLLRAIFEWGIDEKLATENPASLVKVGSDGQRKTILDDAEAYGRLFKALDVMEAEKRIRQPVADAVRIIALTGARRGEVTGMKWKHVDLRRGLVTLPPSSHKTGGKTGEDRIIGLPTVAQAIIARQDMGEADDFVFRPAKGKGPVALNKPWHSIRKAAELPGIGLHGLRHSLASHMAMQGAQASEIMTALGHRNLATSQKYIHWAKEARQAIAETAASVALAGMAASTGQKPADVEPLKGGAK